MLQAAFLLRRLTPVILHDHGPGFTDAYIVTFEALAIQRLNGFPPAGDVRKLGKPETSRRAGVEIPDHLNRLHREALSLQPGL